MNAIRSILVHLDGTQRAGVRLDVAHRLSKAHNATLSAMFAVAPRFLPLPLPFSDGIPAAPLLDEIDPVHRAAAKKIFEQAVAKGASASSWHELSGDAPIQGFVQHALVSDLLVLGQRHPTDAAGFDVPADFVEAVIIDSGRPALIVPCAGHADAEPQTILIAWKATRESAHALTASLPFLQRATNVHVFCSAEDAGDAELALARIGQYLQLHGIEIRKHLGLGGGDVGDSLLSLATEIGAGLLVMGCYGRSRARELVLGGASRTVLESMALPVLMAH
jgi:nucleotide-binding universal stress UspA family protein